MVDTFSEAVKFLEKYIPTPDKKHPGELGLVRMQYLMDLLGNPQLEYSAIHVGGTAGKGSTSTIIASILAEKYKVGFLTSPHLVKINERIKLNGIDIADTDFVKLVNEVIPAIEESEKTELGAPSYFEIVTAMAFLHFRQQKVDFAVVEVGMGGRYDATSVVKPIVAVITNVGLDHTEILGDTVEKIAADKAGIIKSGIDVVTGVKQPSVVDIISTKCKEQNAKLSILGKDFNYETKKLNEEGSTFEYFGRLRLKDLKVNLMGEHQIENAAVSISVIEKLIDRWKLSVKDLREGLTSAYIPGRMEIISKRPLTILDGAHNPDKVRALVSSIKKIFPGRKITSVLAIKSDKNAREMLPKIMKLSKKVILTEFQITGDIGIISSYDPQDLLRIAKTIDKYKQISITNNAKKAFDEAIKTADKDDVILITGSLYLVGEIKRAVSSK